MGGFEDMFVCIVIITYYLLDVDFCSCSFWVFALVVWAWYGMGMVKQDGLDGMDGMGWYEDAICPWVCARTDLCRWGNLETPTDRTSKQHFFFFPI